MYWIVKPYRHGTNSVLWLYKEALQSVLDIPPEDVEGYNNTGFVVLVNGRWEPRFLSEEE